MALLVDADFTLYMSAAACETDYDYGDDVIVVQSRFGDLQQILTSEFRKMSERFPGQDLILFFSDSQNFRKQIYPEYKGARNRKKPCGYRRAIDWLSENYQIEREPQLEADDLLGIWQSRDNSEHIIVSPDKDMRQIPGRIFDGKELFEVTPEEGIRWHLIQSLSGDQTDGYGGCPGIGVKKAEALFDKFGQTWSTVVAAYEKAGLTEADALMNARLAKILQHEDYDFTTQSVRPWTPAAS
jgi:DNA polymerase-1